MKPIIINASIHAADPIDWVLAQAGEGIDECAAWMRAQGKGFCAHVVFAYHKSSASFQSACEDAGYDPSHTEIALLVEPREEACALLEAMDNDAAEMRENADPRKTWVVVAYGKRLVSVEFFDTEKGPEA